MRRKRKILNFYIVSLPISLPLLSDLFEITNSPFMPPYDSWNNPCLGVLHVEFGRQTIARLNKVKLSMEITA
eukprot:scaffold180905_cov44-Prasinocladus_malaysianus.AAC.2